MFLPFGGSGYAALRPRDIAEMPLSEVLWHVKRLAERREQEAESIRNAQGRGEPAREAGPDDAGDE